MDLYNAPPSYYSMIARLALIEAGVAYVNRRMDIHFAKDQLSDWYVAINPHMTVPALIGDGLRLIDSSDILKFATAQAGARWLAPDAPMQARIDAVVAAHYGIDIEKLTFGRAMAKIPPLRLVFPHILRRAVADLEARAATSPNPDALRAKAQVNRDRIAYFTTGDREAKLDGERDHIRRFIADLPQPAAGGLLFGDRPTAADIVVTVLLARLKMVHEWGLVDARADIAAYYGRTAARPSFAAADIWDSFHPLRIIRRR